MLQGKWVIKDFEMALKIGQIKLGSTKEFFMKNYLTLFNQRFKDNMLICLTWSNLDKSLTLCSTLILNFLSTLGPIETSICK